MTNIRPSSLPFNTAPPGEWGLSRDRKHYDRAAVKLAERTGMPLPVAQVYADLNGLGRRR